MRAESAEQETEIAPARRLSDLAYDRILECLFDRRVSVGAFVSQAELSALVGIPVAPLRDALRVLEAEGILTIHPRSGIQFVRPGMELTRATYQFRAIIERAAIRVFAEEGDEEQIEMLHRRHAAFVSSVEKNGLKPEDLVELDEMEHLLHNAVIGILRNPLIEASYRRMHNYLRLLRLDRKLTAPVVLRTLKEHLEIIDACRARDARRAEGALDAHFQAAIHRNLGLI
jgi:DNA-binding GntR family transcriptional regulator